MTGDGQPGAARNAPRRMQEIDMGRAVRFRVEGALNRERTAMAPAHQSGFAVRIREPKLKLGMPVARHL